MLGHCTRSWSRFPPQTEEAQFDEKWAFVYKKEERCDPEDPSDGRCGDHWDHVAFDPEHKLVVALVPGKRTRQNVRLLVREFHRRTGGRFMRLITSDEYKPYRDAILEAYGESYPRRRKGPRGRRPHPGRRAPQGLLYVAVHKHRRKGRVVRVSTHIIYGSREELEKALAASGCSREVNIAFVERYNGTDRHQNARKLRRSYRFSKDWDVHEAATFFSTYSYNFCWAVRTLRERTADGRWGPPCCPAMSAGLTDHVWTLGEWVTLPAITPSSI
jgi:IS1 family transposase